MRDKGYMWVYRSFEQGKELVYYDFSLDRKKENPISFLNNYKGYLQCDAYAGYDFVNDDKDIVRLGCLAHCRRKFEEIIKSYKVKIRSSNNIANGFLNRIAKLYLLEKKVKLEKMNFVEIKKFRNDEAKVILEDLLKFAQEKIIKLANHSPLYKAINYFLNQYQFIINYLEEGYLDIDNNKTENSIRPFALGRKNWLFVGDEQGGTASAIIYSLIESAKANDLNTEKYLTYVLDNVKDNANLKSLLPNHIDRKLIE